FSSKKLRTQNAERRIRNEEKLTFLNSKFCVLRSAFLAFLLTPRHSDTNPARHTRRISAFSRCTFRGRGRSRGARSRSMRSAVEAASGLLRSSLHRSTLSDRGGRRRA